MKKSCGRVSGRPKIMTEDRLKEIRAMIKYAEAYLFVSNVIRAAKIGRRTFYRYFSAEEVRRMRNAFLNQKEISLTSL